jgi:hypothetical protein
MRITIEESYCYSRQPTEDEIREYREEMDHDKRLNLAYEYQISKEDLYEDDYREILEDMYRALEEL